MRKLITAAVLAATLSGCSLYDTYMSRDFDNNEYLIASRIVALAGVAQGCVSLLWIQEQTELLVAYTSGVSNNNKVADAAVKLDAIVGRVIDASNDDDAFCDSQIDTIKSVATKLQLAIGSKTL